MRIEIYIIILSKLIVIIAIYWCRIQSKIALNLCKFSINMSPKSLETFLQKKMDFA